ncbi:MULTISPECIES: DUF4064 domain-containing protein [Paenibacillus]|uniref:DUF4064 domain-containing protein n=1 Tax=Paenibacillus woosongensis TaxID=307580 RepID=A0ABQ4MX98_9BACL|nr:DUF4064 domain-containing protein [Paenibacillus woosongensis]GIP60542.1 hypothetical protein J15TS10_43560 [Paenibacillus woosongensis]
MIKRTAEKTLGIIGSIIVVFIGFFGGVSLVLTKNDEFKTRLNENLNTIQSDTNAVSIIDSLQNAAGMLLWSSIISFILVLIALFNLKKNAKSTLAGILFILSAIVIFISSFFVGFVPGVLFIIAGILALTKKPSTYADQNIPG